jgi:CHAD domain-containing protein
MTKSESAVTFGDWGKVAVEKHFNKILKHEGAVLKDKEPEELHQMRVGIRRLRSAMISFAPAIALPKTSTEKVAGKVGKVLGNLRDLDVLQLTIETEYLPNLPASEQKYLNKVVQKILKKRKKAFKEVKLTLTGEFYQSFKQGLTDWLAQPNYEQIAVSNIELVLPELLLPQVSQLLLHSGWFVGVDLAAGEINFKPEFTLEEVEAVLIRQGQILHNLRKEAKKTRYNMALFTQFYGEEFKSYLETIKNIQEVLGTIQDCFVLKEFLEKTFDSDLEQHLPSLIEQFKQKRYQKWQEWQSLQHQLLDIETRREFQKTIIYCDLTTNN